jgi:hypothetical protein
MWIVGISGFDILSEKYPECEKLPTLKDWKGEVAEEFPNLLDLF